MRILVATDAWHPQVNGVVRSLESMATAGKALDAKIHFLTPQGFATVPLPSYPEIPLAFVPPGEAGRRIEHLAPDHVHIATEGSIGHAVRHYCRRTRRLFTTSYHTRFPEYIAARWCIPRSWTYAWLRRFHNAGIGIMVPTHTISAELSERGFKRLMHWSRGVDQSRFRPRAESVLAFPRPIFLYAGRIAVEKNVEAFLRLDLPGTKVIAGDGPARRRLESLYPQARFLGMQSAESLAQIYASADIFVFPSCTDTFGNVMVEAMACGLPVAALPVPGPIDVIGQSDAGLLDFDLRRACLAALTIPRERALAHAKTFTWAESARQFVSNIEMARRAAQTSVSGTKGNSSARGSRPRISVKRPAKGAAL
ncbi:MAG TPA: glycosyltransferase family 1 protein [Beijerinckiaceae bacterium]|nr:glycosyltransferase family 1 protein [Beijerinckiaceae bacterium]